MDKAETTKEKLSSDVVVATKEHMGRTLNDIFRLMFNLNLAVAQPPVSGTAEEKNSVAAHILLISDKTTICISFRILRATALLIAERVGMKGEAAMAPSVLQDLACEIVNIVANNLRTFLSQNAGVYFEMKPVVRDKKDLAEINPASHFNLDFQITPEALISLGFICDEGQETKPTIN